MQDYERKSISEVVEEINRRYFLPDIQRDFVWKPEQVYALFDSILRDYPISTLLLWKKDGNYLSGENIKKLEFVKTSADINKENTELESSKQYLLVLDGQQRLTAFYLALKGNYIIRNNPYDLYFNIFSGIDELENGDLYEFKFFNNKNGKYFFDKVENKLWLSVKLIYDFKLSQIFTDIPNFCKQIKESSKIDLSDNHKNNIARLCQYLKAEKIIYYYPERESNYDKVLNIFVRTNAGGTKLSYSDLLFSTIKLKWSEARSNFSSLLENLNNGKRYDYSNDFILKTALVLYAKSSEEIRYKTQNFKSDIINKIREDWIKVENSIYLAADLIDSRLFLTCDKVITSYNSLIPIIYWIFKNDIKGMGSENKCLNDESISAISRWLIKALLTGVFGGQSDAILYKCKEAIDSAKSPLFPADEIEGRINSETKKTMKFDADYLDNVSYRDTDSYLVLSVCYKGAINFKPRMKGNLPEQDHIFSRDELKKAGFAEDKINSIYNIRYIGGDDNRIKSIAKYSEWAESLEKDKNIIFIRHLIPEDNWDVQDYIKFLAARKELMIAQFSKQELIQGSNPI